MSNRLRKKRRVFRFLTYGLLAFGFSALAGRILFNTRSAAWILDPVWESGLLVVAAVCGVAALGIVVVRGLAERSLPREEVRADSWEVGFGMMSACLLIALAYALPGSLEIDGPTKNRYEALAHLRETARVLEDHWRETGSLPLTLSELPPLATRKDPFGALGTEDLRWYPSSATSGILLSVGPDGINQFEEIGELVAFEKSSGSFSSGDLWLEVAAGIRAGSPGEETAPAGGD
jgi:hypothetical protein